MAIDSAGVTCDGAEESPGARAGGGVEQPVKNTAKVSRLSVRRKIMVACNGSRFPAF